jgi:RNA polymerase sigma-70 factor (ECF subfamily)
MINNKLTSEDIIQNVFLKLFERKETIRAPESVQCWLFSTVRNEIYSYYRSKKIKVDQFFAEDSNNLNIPSDDLIFEKTENYEVKELIMNELNKMPVEQREVFLLKEYGELSYKEISKMMNISEELVKSRLFNTRQRLIKKLSKILTE